MKKYLPLLAVSLLIFVTACTSQQSSSGNSISCPNSYLPIGDNCCVDKDNNKICDDDDVVRDQLEEKELERAARDFARFLEKGDSYELYDLLTEKKKSMMTRDEFIKRHAQLYGSYFNDAREVKPKSVGFSEAKVKSDNGYVNFFITYNKWDDRFSAVYYFKKENGQWKYDGFDEAFYAYCNSSNDCGSELLNKECQSTCTSKGYPLKIEKPYTCLAHTCKCECYGSNNVGESLNPLWNTIH